MRRRARAAVFALVAAVALMAHPAGACSCAARALPDQVATADLVFVGSVDQVRVDASKLTARFDVSLVFKGATGRETVIQTPADSAACGTVFAVHQSYAVFANRQGETLVTNLCSGTTSDAAALSGLTPVATVAPQVGSVSSPSARTVPMVIAAGLIVVLLAAKALARDRTGPRPFV